MKNNSVCKENGSNVFRKEREQYHEIQDLKAQMQDKNIAVSELKKLIEKYKGKSVETQFDKPSIVRQPNAQRILKPSGLGKPTPFSNSPEMRRMYRIPTTTTQTRTPQLPHASRNTNPHVSKSTGVNHYTSVSRPQLKSYQVKDKVVPNNSQVKFNQKEVEEHHRISNCTTLLFIIDSDMHKDMRAISSCCVIFVEKFLEKTDSSHQGLEFLFSPLIEEYYTPTHSQAEENNNDQAPNASFQEDEFINPFCTRIQETSGPSSWNIDNTDVHSFQPQSHDYRWTRDHPFRKVLWKSTMPVQSRRLLATDLK
ncbi:hypothetical protein Tco_1247654 [Tanacetum coccineum]